MGRRRLIRALVLALVAAAPTFAQTSEEWGLRWDEAAGLAQLDPSTEAFSDLAARLASIAEEARPDARAALLARLVERARGSEPAPPTETETGLENGDQAWPFDRRESWLFAEVGPTLAVRSRAVREGLAREPGVRLEREALLTAWRTGAAEAREFRLESALSLQRELYDRYREPWSSMDLALTLSWADRAQEAVLVLTETIEAEQRAGRFTGELYSRRGLTYLGSGQERLARDDFGRALAQGSSNAAVVLARLDLDQGARRAARVGFRSLLDVDSPGPWEQRGWGLSLLGGTESATSPAQPERQNTPTKEQ